jgi:CelD/BcsL family acetyltransferase involved in cellulose biosynthesis
MRADVLDDGDAAERWSAGWDCLAEASGRPYCAPAWMLSWWRHVAPAEARLRVVLAVDGDELLGVAPFYQDVGYGGLTRYRTLAGGTGTPVEPLMKPGHEAAVLAVFAESLPRLDPRPDVFVYEGVPSTSPWNRLGLAPHRARPWIHVDASAATPVMTLRGRSFDDWFAARSRNFRSQMRRMRRQLDERGATFRLARTHEEVDEGLRDFVRLHRARWDSRGGSRALRPGVEQMLRDASRRLLAQDRLRLWSIDVDGRTISSHLFVGAGGHLSYWLGGFDDAWAPQKPAMQTLFAAVEHAWAAGDEVVDFGYGGQPYKYRFADADSCVEWTTVVPIDRRYVRTRLHLLPKQTYRGLSRHLPDAPKERLRKMVGGRPGWAD